MLVLITVTLSSLVETGPNVQYLCNYFCIKKNNYKILVQDSQSLKCFRSNKCFNFISVLQRVIISMSHERNNYIETWLLYSWKESHQAYSGYLIGCSHPTHVTMSRTSSVVRWMTLNQEVPGSSLDTAIWEKNLLVLLDKALYLRLSWIMTTFCPSIMSMAMAP